MNLLRAATLTTADLDATVDRYAQWLDYALVEQGDIPVDLAASWGAPASAGKRFAVMRPASGVDAYLRFIEDAPVAGYEPLRTFGWAAVEICNQDVLAVNERMLRSPFEIIGPPKTIDGIPTIHPMQVKGPDKEIVYLTEIKPEAQGMGLPRPQSFIDRLFILVMACLDMDASAEWFTSRLKLTLGPSTSIVYTMINGAFGLPSDTKHAFRMGGHDGDVFIEFDQYPGQTIARPRHDGALPPGVSLCTLKHPDFDAIDAPWIAPPTRREGPLYGGGRVGTVAGPDGTLIEVVEI
jgi:catechol 2,3-dioxygenase-like lactoylglutathione lyase family enzyme